MSMTESVFSQADREAARKRCDVATKGPWYLDSTVALGAYFVWKAEGLGTSEAVMVCRLGSCEQSEWLKTVRERDANGKFITNARMDLPAALDELDLRDKEREEKDRRIAWLEEENARLGQAISVGKLQLEDDITDLRKAVAERDEALEFMAQDKRPICVATIYGGGCIAYHHTTDEEIGRGPTPLAAIQDAMKKAEGGE